MIFVLITLLASCSFVCSIPIDNGVEGEPEIECAADSITVNFNVRNDFQGHVYVKGRFAEGSECRTDGSGGGRRVAGIKLPFTACGTRRERSLSPKGVFVSNTVVITFHPQFLTKVDRAYTVQCFYMEADKTVSQDLEVSEITTVLQTQAAIMPVCRYDILEGGPGGQAVKFAIIGQQVYHKWTCDTETVDMFCMLVHSCTVDDGAGNNVQLLNEQGCALDRHLLGNLEYQTDLMAGHEAHVFKYADKPALFFNCQVSILGKEPGQPCQRPQCPEPGGPGGASAGGAAPPPPASPRPNGSIPPRVSTPPRASTPRGPQAPAPVAASLPPARGTAPPGITPRAPGTGTTPVAPAPLAADRRFASQRDANAISTSSGNQPRLTGRQDLARLGGRVFKFRYARNVDERVQEAAKAPSHPDIFGTWDVAAQSITALEIGVDETNVPSYINNHSSNGTLFSQIDRHDQVCLQPFSLAIMVTLSIISILFGTAVTALTCFCRRDRKLF